MASTLHLLLEHLVGAVRPLRDAVQDLESFQQLMRELGWDVDELAYQELGADVGDLVAAFEGLAADPDPLDLLDVFERVGSLRKSVAALNTAPAGVDPADRETFLDELPERLFEFLLIEYLDERFPAWSAFLRMLGVIEEEHHAATPSRRSFLRARIRVENLEQVFSDPAGAARNVYGWSTDGFSFAQLADDLLELGTALGFLVTEERGNADAGRDFQEGEKPIDRRFYASFFDVVADDGDVADAAIAIYTLPAEGDAGPGVLVQPLVDPRVDPTVQLDEHWTFALRPGSDRDSAFGVVLRPGETSARVPLTPGAGLPGGGFGATLSYRPGDELLLFGDSNGTRLAADGLVFGLDVDAIGSEVELRLSVALEGLRFLLTAADLGAFWGTLLSGADVDVKLPWTLTWSSRTGLEGSVGLGLSTTLYPRLRLGPVELRRVDLSLMAGLGEPTLELRTRTYLVGSLGPISFTAGGMGQRLALRYGDGNAGPLDVDFGIVAPTQIGVGIDTWMVRGAGLLELDPERGRYQGWLQLEVMGIAVSALAVLDTKNEDGEALPRVSFLVLVFVDGFTPVQLGLGFTLRGVGGLLGVDRTVSTAEIENRFLVEGGEDFLFPENVDVSTAPGILSDLGAIFPVRSSHYLFGPAGSFGWGTPNLVDVRLLFVLELPEPRVVVIGLVDTEFPPGPIKLLELHVRLTGELDVQRGSLVLHAEIHRSSFIGIAIDGDAGLLIRWGRRPAFALSLGGFHSLYSGRHGLPDLDRLEASLPFLGFVEVSIRAFFAVTTNTIQIGGEAEVTAGPRSLHLHGFVEIEALVQFVPLYFDARMAAGVSLRAGGRRLGGARLRGRLTGPWPFRAKGKATMSTWLLDVSVPFSASFGESHEQDVETETVLPRLADDLVSRDNWEVREPSWGRTAVTLRSVADAAPPVDPFATLALVQRYVPLDRTIDKVGEWPPADGNRFTVSDVTLGAGPSPTSPVEEPFAVGRFHDLTDEGKLAAPIEDMEAGFALPGDLRAGNPVTADVVFEERMDGVVSRYTFARADEDRAAARYLRISGAGFRRRGHPGFLALEDPHPAVRLEEKRWVIASTADLSVRTDLGTWGRSAARDRLERHVAEHPEERGELQVIALHELEDAR